MRGFVVGCLALTMLLSPKHHCVRAETTILEEEVPGKYRHNAVKYNRFAKRTKAEQSKQFVGGTWDWSGVGRQYEPERNLGRVQGASRWATLISPSFAVSLSHAKIQNPLASHFVFYLTEDPSGPTEVVNVAELSFDTNTSATSSTRGNTPDFLLLRFAEPTRRAAIYPVYVADNFRDLDVVQFGVGRHPDTDPTTAPLPDTHKTDPLYQKLGRQRIVANYPWTDPDGEAFPFLGNNLRYAWNSAQSPPDFLLARNVDSGAPGFTILRGQGPALVCMAKTGEAGSAGDSRIQPNTWYYPLNSAVSAFRKEIIEAMARAQRDRSVDDREQAIFVTHVPGDFDGSGTRTGADMEILRAEVSSRNQRSRRSQRGHLWPLDVNGDGEIDREDLAAWQKLTNE